MLLWNGLCPVAGCSICIYETSSYIFGQCISGWNSCLVSWFITSTVHGIVFQTSLKLIAFSYDSQQYVTGNVAYSKFPGICNCLPQQNIAYLPHCYRYHQAYQFLLYIWNHIRFLTPKLTSNTTTKASLAAKMCQYIAVFSYLLAPSGGSL